MDFTQEESVMRKYTCGQTHGVILIYSLWVLHAHSKVKFNLPANNCLHPVDTIPALRNFNYK